MSGAVGLDLRYPIGTLFAVLGLIIGGYGLATNGDVSHYARSEAININLWWGLVMLVFGLLLLVLARRGGPTVRPAANSPEGLATEAREHRRGLEHER
jgi:hypothetical protein